MSQSADRRTVHLLGTTLEGGGQLIRLALSFSSLSCIPVHITRIRGGRPGGGGLKSQHLRAVTWLAQACGARLRGADKGSQELDFQPSNTPVATLDNVEGGVGNTLRTDVKLAREENIRHVTIDQATPGSIGLVLQAVLPFLIFCGASDEPGSAIETSRPALIKLTIQGGTNVSFSPSYEYISQVLLPTLQLIGVPPISASLHSRGWTHGPQKVGSVDFLITPFQRGATLPAFELQDRGALESIHVSLLAPETIRKHLRREVTDALEDVFPTADVHMAVDEDSESPKRLYLLLVAETSGGHRLGRDWLYDEKITDPSAAGRKLVRRVVRELEAELLNVDGDERGGACMDEYMQDQLVVFQALAKGNCRVNGGDQEGPGAANTSRREIAKRPSLHTKTAHWVASQVLGVEFDKDGNCQGVGFVVGEDYSQRARAAELVPAVKELKV
ncbi:MAG: hypothetical protein M1837_006495 [Sclerophora amabilis]|nr:MAG: hypothetical protein M1837_006495 [Sclerophora amabilis]